MGQKLVWSKMIEYVLMNESHVEAIAEIEKLCFSDPWSVNSISSELGNRLSLWYVAMDGDTLAGYVGSQTVLGSADMMNLAVHPDYRRQGIGIGLICALVDGLAQKGANCLLLEVRESNKPAIDLYEKMGFHKVGRRPGYYHNPKEAACIMRKELDA